MEKLEKWSEDVKKSLELELKNLDMEIKFKKAEARKLLKLEDKLNMQKEIKELEKKRNNLRFNLLHQKQSLYNQFKNQAAFNANLTSSSKSSAEVR